MATLIGCQSDGDGGVTASGNFLSQGATFATDTLPTTGPEPYVFLRQDPGDRTSVCLGVEGQLVQNLFSLAFTLRYDPNVLRFRDFTEASLLGTGSQVIVEVTPQPASSPVKVVVGITRNAAVVGNTGITGNGRFITLCFDLVAPATASPLVFTDNLVGYDPNGTAPANVVIDALDFYGGTITVR